MESPDFPQPVTHKNLSKITRPKKFSDVVGQELPVRILCNSLASDRIFPTYIFAGQRGSGKTTCARIFAGGLCCQKRKDPSWDRRIAFPCNQCDWCKIFLAGTHPDFCEIDGASNSGVDNIREIQELATYAPVLSTHKIYLIDEAHMLSKAAFNAFLKVLEEPLGHVVFLMATTELAKFPETVRSRALILNFAAHSQAQIGNYLTSVIETQALGLAPEIASMVAANSGGAMRDALNRLEQIWLIAFGQDREAQVAAAKEVLGVVDRRAAFELGADLLGRHEQALLCKMAKIASDAIAVDLFRTLGEYFSACFRFKIGAKSSLSEELLAIVKTGSSAVEKNSIAKIIQLWWSAEIQFISGRSKALFLEGLVIQALQSLANPSSPGTQETPPTTQNITKSAQPSSKNPPTAPVVDKTSCSTQAEPANSSAAQGWWARLISSSIVADNGGFLKAILMQSTPQVNPEGPSDKFTIKTNSEFFKAKLSARIDDFNSTLVQMGLPERIVGITVSPCEASPGGTKPKAMSPNAGGLAKPPMKSKEGAVGPKTKLLQDEFLL